MNRFRLKILFPLFFCIVLISCNKEKDLHKPLCEISSPDNGDKFIAGNPVSFHVNAEDDDLIVDVKLPKIDAFLSSINQSKFSKNFIWQTKSSDIGSHYITAIVIDNDGLFSMDSVLVNIIEDTAVVADFVVNNATIKAGESVSFEDHSKNQINSWFWTFGDGQTSIEQNPVHTYSNIGTYTVSLVAESPFGKDTLYKYNSIIVTNEDGTSSSLTDNEGYKYPIVKIGTQWWMAENLRVSRYNDNSNIDEVENLSLWASASRGIFRFKNIVGQIGAPYTWYTNDTVFYYNWYCVSSGKLSPKGWHIPSDSEWKIMVNYLGGESIAGGKLKYADTLRWNDPNIGGTNETGFSAIPADGIYALGAIFMDIGRSAWFWSSTFNDYQRPSSWGIINTGPEIIFYKSNHKEDGYPVRCIKD